MKQKTVYQYYMSGNVKEHLERELRTNEREILTLRIFRKENMNKS